MQITKMGPKRSFLHIVNEFSNRTLKMEGTSHLILPFIQNKYLSSKISKTWVMITSHAESKNWVRNFVKHIINKSSREVPKMLWTSHSSSSSIQNWQNLKSDSITHAKRKKTKIGVKTFFSSYYTGGPLRCCGWAIPA